jgi:hypothetical protein
LDIFKGIFFLPISGANHLIFEPCQINCLKQDFPEQNSKKEDAIFLTLAVAIPIPTVAAPNYLNYL